MYLSGPVNESSQPSLDALRATSQDRSRCSRARTLGCRMFRRIGLVALIVLATAACGGPVVTPPPTPVPLLPTVSVANGTSIPVAIAVNGTVVETMPAGTTEDPITATLPARPWTVEARSPSGRVLADLTVNAQDYIANNAGKAVREDLACGRLDLWSGPPLLGPMFSPDASKPCD